MLKIMYVELTWLNEYAVMNRANDHWLCNVVGCSFPPATDFVVFEASKIR